MKENKIQLISDMDPLYQVLTLTKEDVDFQSISAVKIRFIVNETRINFEEYLWHIIIVIIIRGMHFIILITLNIARA